MALTSWTRKNNELNVMLQIPIEIDPPFRLKLTHYSSETDPPLGQVQS